MLRGVPRPLRLRTGCYGAFVVMSERTGVREIPIARLRLDPSNPRLPQEMHGGTHTQRDIALFINKEYEPLAIAESISRHKFFESEPLIAVPDGELFTVIEGNRRLTALMGLSDPELRAAFIEENVGWRNIDPTDPPRSVPVLVVDDPDDVAPLLGFRHISGIEPWEPYAQARYIAHLADGGRTLDEVAELVGRSPTEVKSKYRDYEILRQASENFAIDTRRARDAFGIFNNAMGRRAIRDFISAPDPRNVDPEYWPIPDSRRDNVEKLLRLIFGQSKGEGRVVTDSRQLGDLAKVLADPTGRALAVLEATGDLSDALDETSEPSEQYARSVSRALKALKKAAALTNAQPSESSYSQIRQMRDLVDDMLRERGDGSIP